MSTIHTLLDIISLLADLSIIVMIGSLIFFHLQDVKRNKSEY